MRRARLIPLAVVCASVLLPRVGRAQWTVSAELGAAHLRQTGIQESSAATLGLNADWTANRASLHGSLLGARASENRWTGQGLVLGSVSGPIRRGVSWELVPVAGFFAETNGLPTVSDELVGRLRLGSGARGAAIGAGAGTTSLGSDAHGLFLAEADGWRVVGREQLTAGVSYVDTRSALFRQLAAIPVRYADLIGGWRHDAPSWSLSASAGVRRGWSGAPSSDSWGSVEGTAWLGEHLGLVIGGGRTVEDVTRGVPRTTFVSVALRITNAVHAPVSRARVTGPQLSVVPGADGARTVVVTTREGATVELIADFTDWQPIALTGDGRGQWRATREIAPGLHRVALRIDGGRWIVPGNLPRVTDDLGGDVGLITIP
ncbi:MAG TPA: glycogen-binding domain-containing protein [Gemmatimonadaceae bacterium]|nr:glycogen-binding domain-containing protein [Gemmatimonadaceae bacterium]